VVAAASIGHPKGHREALQEGVVLPVPREVEQELVVARGQFPPDQIRDAPIGVGLAFVEHLELVVVPTPEEDDADPGRGGPRLHVENVGRYGGTRRVRGAVRTSSGHAILRVVGDLQIRVGDLHFTARWEEAAPRTREALQGWLPIRSQLIHCRWSGEGTWIPFGDRRPDVGYENHTAHPAPGQLLIYTGELSECEILFPYGACAFSSKLGPLAGNHFATVVSGAEQLPEMGRRVLWEGAQDIEITEGPD